MPKLTYTFSAQVWQHASPGGWCFVSLPVELAKEIRTHLQQEEQGWGRLKATATINKSTWATAIWFDTKHHTYLLPIKATIRKKENIHPEAIVQVSIDL
jgi:hypothetical protein